MHLCRLVTTFTQAEGIGTYQNRLSKCPSRVQRAVTKALGMADPAVLAVLQPFTEIDFKGLSFGDKLAALAALGALSPVVQIKLARHL